MAEPMHHRVTSNPHPSHLPALRQDVKLLRLANEALTAVDKRFVLDSPYWCQQDQKAFADTKQFLRSELLLARHLISILQEEAG